MSRDLQPTRPTGQRTLGPFFYAMPIMPAILTFGPLIIVIPMQSIFAMIASVVFGIGLGLLWLCMMRIAQRLDQLTEGPVTSPAIAAHPSATAAGSDATA